MSEDFNGIFGHGPRHDGNNENGNSKEYRVSYKQGKDNVYTSLIRFVINPKDPAKCINSKYVTWLKDPVTGKSRPVDNPRTVCSDYNPLDSMFWPLYKSGNQKLQDLAKDCISTSQQNASIIQVINDVQRPELNGKFLIFKYGKKIRDMIEAEESGTQYTKPNDPWDVFNGRAFMLQCTNQGGNNNYDKSKFIDSEKSGLLFTTGQKDAAGKDLLFVATPDIQNIQQILFNYLTENCPDLSEYDYKPWDSQTEDYVNQTLAIIESAAKNGGVPVKVNTFGVNQSNVVNSIPGVSSDTPMNVQSILGAQMGAMGVQPQVHMVQPVNVVQPQVSVPQQQQIPVSQIELPNLNAQSTQETTNEPDSKFGDINNLVTF